MKTNRLVFKWACLRLANATFKAHRAAVRRARQDALLARALLISALICDAENWSDWESALWGLRRAVAGSHDRLETPATQASFSIPSHPHVTPVTAKHGLRIDLYAFALCLSSHGFKPILEAPNEESRLALDSVDCRFRLGIVCHGPAAGKPRNQQ
jgi:hypothetical protein